MGAGGGGLKNPDAAGGGTLSNRYYNIQVLLAFTLALTNRAHHMD